MYAYTFRYCDYLGGEHTRTLTAQTEYDARENLIRLARNNGLPVKGWITTLQIQIA